MIDDRRKRSRVPVHFEVSILVEEAWCHVKTLNLSLTGLLCVTHPRFQNDAPCQIRIQLNDRVTISLEGKILRIHGNETAIGFTSMDEESFFHLRRIMELNIGDADQIIREMIVPAYE